MPSIAAFNVASLFETCVQFAPVSCSAVDAVALERDIQARLIARVTRQIVNGPVGKPVPAPLDLRSSWRRHRCSGTARPCRRRRRSRWPRPTGCLPRDATLEMCSPTSSGSVIGVQVFPPSVVRSRPLRSPPATEKRRVAAERAEAPGSGEQYLRVARIHFQRGNGQRLLEVGERRPRGTGRGGVARPPDAAVDRADVQDVRDRWDAPRPHESRPETSLFGFRFCTCPNLLGPGPCGTHVPSVTARLGSSTCERGTIASRLRTP